MRDPVTTIDPCDCAFAGAFVVVDDGGGVWSLGFGCVVVGVCVCAKAGAPRVAAIAIVDAENATRENLLNEGIWRGPPSKDIVVSGDLVPTNSVSAQQHLAAVRRTRTACRINATSMCL